MRLARALGARWDAINATHLAILRRAVEAHDGVIVRTEGDALFAAFGEAGAAVEAAVDAQRVLADRVVAGWRGRPRPDGAPHRRGASRGRRLRRLRRQPGRAHRRGRSWRADRPVRHDDDRSSSRRCRPASACATSAATRCATSPSRSTSSSSTPRDSRTEFPPLRVAGSDRREPARPADDVRRAIGGPRGARCAARRPPARDASPVRAGSARRASPSSSRGHGPGSLPRRRVARRARRRRPTRRMVVPGHRADARPVRRRRPSGGRRAAGVPRRPLAAAPARQLRAPARRVGRGRRARPACRRALRFVVTSRAPLHVGGEQEYPLRPLAVGGRPARPPSTADPRRRPAGCSSTGRGPSGPIGTRSRRRRSSARSARSSTGCRSASSSPPRAMSLLPPAAIRDRLAAHLPLPGSGPRDAPARQRTLEGAIDWSHDLLTPGRAANAPRAGRVRGRVRRRPGRRGRRRCRRWRTATRSIGSSRSRSTA